MAGDELSAEAIEAAFYQLLADVENYSNSGDTSAMTPLPAAVLEDDAVVVDEIVSEAMAPEMAAVDAESLP